MARRTVIGGRRASASDATVGQPAQTLDKVTVRPVNRATSALYAYTPWEGTKAGNGSYLAWQILRRFAVHIQETRGAGAPQADTAK